MLHAHNFFSDTRIADAKKLILETILEHQASITAVRPADQSRCDDYKKNITLLSHRRAQMPFFPYLASGIGNGALVELDDGSVKYDFIGNIGVHSFGHSNPDIISAAIDGALSDTVVQGHLQPGKEYNEFLTLITEASGFAHGVITPSGALSCENALKLAFARHRPRARVIACENCFMGRTLAMTQLSAIGSDKELLPHTIDVDYIPYYDHANPKESSEASIRALKKHLENHPNEYAAICFELVQGNGGLYPGTREFFVELMKLARSHSIAVIVDEVQTFGRTSELFAFQHFDLKEYVDIVAFGKLSQACGTLFREEYRPTAGIINQTFAASCSAMAVGKVIIEKLLSEGYFGHNGKIASFHERFVGNLKDIARRYPRAISGPYGIGAMIAFTPYDGSKEAAENLAQELYEHGVIAFVCGGNPKRMRFLPPIGALTMRDIDAVTEIIEQVIKKHPHSQR